MVHISYCTKAPRGDESNLPLCCNIVGSTSLLSFTARKSAEKEAENWKREDANKENGGESSSSGSGGDDEEDDEEEQGETGADKVQRKRSWC